MGDDDSAGSDPERISSLWVRIFRCARAGPKCLWSKNPNPDLEEEIRSLCDKVINHRLKKIDTSDRRNNATTRTVRCFCAMTDIMITQNPELYSELSSKLSTQLETERVVCKAYTDFAEALFEKETTWPLIISLLTFSGALAAECSRNGRSVLVRSICDWTTIFMVIRLKDWIRNNGNLLGLVKFVSPETASIDESPELQRITDRRKLSFDDVTRVLYEKARTAYSVFGEMSLDERVHRITLVVGVLFIILNVLWIILAR